jgi:type IV pilus assembly protein PilX
MKPDTSYPSRDPFEAPKGERGIVLILALILLVIISMVAIMAVKGSISGEQVSNNVRSNAVATQAAETALRYCEQDVLSAAPVLVVNDIPLGATQDFPNLWATRANWINPALANTATVAITISTDAAGRTLTTLPRCMIERYQILALPGENPREAYVITSLGFSPDYATNAGGQVISGGEAWLQSILRY